MPAAPAFLRCRSRLSAFRKFERPAGGDRLFHSIFTTRCSIGKGASTLQACPLVSFSCGMPRADQRLYAALLRVGRQFVSERIPLLGVAGSEVVCYNLAWRHALRVAVQSPPPGAGLAGEAGGLLAWCLADLPIVLAACVNSYSCIS